MNRAEQTRISNSVRCNGMEDCPLPFGEEWKMHMQEAELFQAG